MLCDPETNSSAGKPVCSGLYVDVWYYDTPSWWFFHMHRDSFILSFNCIRLKPIDTAHQNIWSNRIHAQYYELLTGFSGTIRIHPMLFLFFWDLQSHSLCWELTKVQVRRHIRQRSCIWIISILVIPLDILAELLYILHIRPPQRCCVMMQKISIHESIYIWVFRAKSGSILWEWRHLKTPNTASWNIVRSITKCMRKLIST